MKKVISFFSLFVFAGIFFAAEKSSEYKKFNGWKQAETEHFNFIFEEESRLATENYALIADDAWNKIGKIYGFPKDKTNIYVFGRTNTVNAFTYFAPTEIIMFNSPVLIPDFTFRDNWMKLFFTHELIHAANANLEDKEDNLSKIFGKAFKNFDFSSVPGWALEGLTTVLETELTDGGRGRSPYFELMYKAPTLDNSFISYSEIGLEEEPPLGQSYVMGYLIMRSIADRWGLPALADIERNRNFSRSWEESVKLVTGETAQDIYKDLKIALAKKYADERSIPEGITITPREANTYFYKPSVILDDGTFISLRGIKGKGTAVVKYDPSLASGSKFIEDIEPEKDLNSVSSETILFSGSFSDDLAVTADQEENIYASMSISRNDRKPGLEIQYSLFKWTKDDGLKQLTENTSLYQPSVSRDGKTLVAVQQNGMDMQLVQVDVESGEISPLLYRKDLSFAQPSVNADGSKVAFLVLDGKRAKVAVAEIGDKAPEITYEIVGNDGEQIFDPSYPSWNSDGKLTYTCNYRGRLEVVEFDENSEFSAKPVVSDPIGALWAYSTERGIYYWSYASSGDVIKMKPLSAWGEVPDFDGPSASGEKICFGDLENDYPEFKPYVLLSEVEIPAESKEEKKKSFKEKLEKVSESDKKDSKEKDSKEPKPIEGKKVEHRSQENIEKAEKASSTQTVLQNERNFIPLPQPLLYMLFPNFLTSETTDEMYLGLGGIFLALTPKLQLSMGFVAMDAFYYPKLNNFDGSIVAGIPVNNSEIDIFINRNIKFEKADDKELFYEKNDISAGYAYPFISRSYPLHEIDLRFISIAEFTAIRSSEEIFNLNSDLPFENSLSLKGGFELYESTKNSNKNIFSVDVYGLAHAYYDFDYKNMYLGAEFGTSMTSGSSVLKYGFDVFGHYADFPSKVVISNDGTKIPSVLVDCTYPGLILTRVNTILPNFLVGGLDLEVYGEAQFLFGRNTVDSNTPENDTFLNFTINDTLAAGAEFSLKAGLAEVCAGGAFLFDYNNFEYKDFKFYISGKYNAFKF